LYVVEKETAARAHGGRNVATFYLHAPISTALLLFIIKRGNVCTSFRQDSQPAQLTSERAGLFLSWRAHLLQQSACTIIYNSRA
jgi:hypothetical protein